MGKTKGLVSKASNNTTLSFFNTRGKSDTELVLTKSGEIHIYKDNRYVDQIAIGESSGGSEPAGNDTEIQYNDGGTLGASDNLTFDGSTLSLPTSSSSVVIGESKLTGLGSLALQIQGTAIGASILVRDDVVTISHKSVGYHRESSAIAGAAPTNAELIALATSMGLTSDSGTSFYLQASGGSTSTFHCMYDGSKWVYNEYTAAS